MATMTPMTVLESLLLTMLPRTSLVSLAAASETIPTVALRITALTVEPTSAAGNAAEADLAAVPATRRPAGTDIPRALSRIFSRSLARIRRTPTVPIGQPSCPAAASKLMPSR